MSDYEEWHRRLSEAFFQPSESGVFSMFLDETEAGRIWPELEEPSRDLATAVSERLFSRDGASPFRAVERLTAEWAGGERTNPPPSLPLLAVTVLAACSMHRDRTATANAYFIRLAQVLRPGCSEQEHEELRKQLSGGFDAVAGMWRQLDQWVTSHSETLGSSTIRDHPRLTRIGYPLSQALVRRSDRIRLTAFFQALEIGKLEVPAPEALFRFLGIWMARPRGMSDGFVRAATDPDTAGLIKDHVWRLASTWDGLVLTEEGRRRLDFRVVLDLSEFEASWAIPVVADVGSDTLRLSTGGLATIAQPQHGALYDISGDLPKVHEGLDRGLRAKGEVCEVVAEPRPLMALRLNTSAGAWMSVDGLQPYEEHLLVVEPRLREDVEAVLRTAADPGWKVIPQRSDQALLPGRLIYRKVRLSDPAAFEAAAAGLDPSLAATLRPDRGLRPQLVNGLRVGRELGGRHYLAGGEPDLVLPVGTTPRHVAAALDGSSQEPPFLATGFPIELRRQGPFPLGRHELDVDGDRLVFHVHDDVGVPQRAQPDYLGWVASAQGLVLEEGVSIGECISGASVEGGCSEPLLIRRGTTVWIIDRSGRISEQTEPAPAPLFATLGLPPPYYFEIFPGDGAVWVVEVRQQRPQRIRRIRWIEPHVRRLDELSIKRWHLMRGVASDDKLWDIYAKAWKAYSNGL